MCFIDVDFILTWYYINVVDFMNFSIVDALFSDDLGSQNSWLSRRPSVGFPVDPG